MLRHRAADRIPAKSNGAAQERFLMFLRQSLRALTDSAGWFTKPPIGETSQRTAFTSPPVLKIPTVDPDRSYYLRSTIAFTFGDHPDYKGDKKVFTEFYAHTISLEPSMATELWSWQWHPEGHEDAHVHVTAHADGVGGLHKLHLPTGRITWEQVVRFILTDLGGLPNRALGDTDEERLEAALDLLGDSHQRVHKYGRNRR